MSKEISPSREQYGIENSSFSDLLKKDISQLNEILYSNVQSVEICTKFVAKKLHQYGIRVGNIDNIKETKNLFGSFTIDGKSLGVDDRAQLLLLINDLSVSLNKKFLDQIEERGAQVFTDAVAIAKDALGPEPSLLDTLEEYIKTTDELLRAECDENGVSPDSKEYTRAKDYYVQALSISQEASCIQRDQKGEFQKYIDAVETLCNMIFDSPFTEDYIVEQDGSTKTAAVFVAISLVDDSEKTEIILDRSLIIKYANELLGKLKGLETKYLEESSAD